MRRYNCELINQNSLYIERGCVLFVIQRFETQRNTEATMKKQPSQTRKKMALSKETLRLMTALDLKQVAGGTYGPTADCTGTCSASIGCD
jgi:hypothetical protein